MYVYASNNKLLITTNTVQVNDYLLMLREFKIIIVMTPLFFFFF